MDKEEFEKIFRKPAAWVAGETQGRLVLAPWYVWIWRGVCKVLSYPAAWIVSALTALAMLGGCSGLPCSNVEIHHVRKDGKISGDAKWSDCNPVQSPFSLPVGL